MPLSFCTIHLNKFFLTSILSGTFLLFWFWSTWIISYNFFFFWANGRTLRYGTLLRIKFSYFSFFYNILRALTIRFTISENFIFSFIYLLAPAIRSISTFLWKFLGFQPIYFTRTNSHISNLGSTLFLSWNHSFKRSTPFFLFLVAGLHFTLGFH